jgi:hypothetical protein
VTDVRSLVHTLILFPGKISLWIILTVAYAGVTMQIDRAVHDPKVYKTWHTVRNKLLRMSKEFHGFLALSDAATLPRYIRIGCGAFICSLSNDGVV